MSGQAEIPVPQPPPHRPLSGDWPSDAADAVVELVGAVRDRTIRPLLTLVRGVVYGLVIAVISLMAAVLILIALVRFVDSYLPGEVWSAHLLIGAIFTSAGLLLWSQRQSKG